MATTQPTTYYTCSPYSTPDLLRTSGVEPLELTIQYIYEVDVVPNKPLDAAIQHVSTTLLKRIAKVGNLVECMGGTATNSENNPFRRRLRFRGRGSNSLLGIEASDGGRIETGQVCQFQSSSIVGGDDVEDEEEQFLEGVTGDFSGSVILEAEVDQQQVGDREDTDRDNDTDGDNILAETRVDGVIDPASVIRSAPLEIKKEVDVEGESGVAYNYLSTQSEIKEAQSIRSQPTVGENTNIGSVSYRQGTVATPNKLRSGIIPGAKCNVIQGQITLFISNTADPFENLDGRILEAIKNDLNDEMVLQQEFLTDEVVGIRLLEPALAEPAVVEDTLSPLPPVPVAAPVVVTSAAASAPSNINPSSGFASSNAASIGVIGGLGAIFLMLVGLFAYTSRPRKSRYLLGVDDDLKSCQYDNDKCDQYDDDDTCESEFDAVAGVLGETESTATWWQEPVKMSRNITDSSIPTVEACYSAEGVVIGNDHNIDEAFGADRSPRVLPLSFFNNKSKARNDEEMDATSNIVDDLIKSESLLDDERSSSTVDMDAHLYQGAEKSKKSKSTFGRRFFGRKHANDDVLIDDDIVIEEIPPLAKSQDEEVFIQESFSQDGLGIETTTPLQAMAAYPSPSLVSSRSRSRNSKDNNSNRIVQKFSSGALSCIPGLPSPEIGDEQSDVSTLTDNYYGSYYSRRGPDCTQGDGEQLIRLATNVVTQCIAPTTTDNTSVSIPTSVATPTKEQQLAQRQANGFTVDPFAECWNPFEGNFWQGWFE